MQFPSLNKKVPKIPWGDPHFKGQPTFLFVARFSISAETQTSSTQDSRDKEHMGNIVWKAGSNDSLDMDNLLKARRIRRQHHESSKRLA